MDVLCRPDSFHWCVECCSRSGSGCVLLGYLEDGSRGCLGHNRKGELGIEKPSFCKNFYCLDGYSQEIIEEIRKKILGSPPGEFKMSSFLADYSKE